MEEQVLTLKDNLKDNRLAATLREACKKIAPVWPLERFVAVNPYLGLTDKKFETVAQQLATVGGIQMTLPTSFYTGKLKEGVISNADIKNALSKNSSMKMGVEEFLKSLIDQEDQDQQVATISTLTDVATNVTQKDWNRFVISSISTWAASYFDEGQAVWAASDKSAAPFAAWKTEAEVDRTTEIAGLKNFRKFVKNLPDNPVEASGVALQLLELSDKELPLYLHRLLLRVGGWSAYAARLDWDSELYGGKDGKLIEFLSILICWEACLFQSLDSPKLRVKWIGAKRGMTQVSESHKISGSLNQKLILQEAFDLAIQREIIGKFKGKKATKTSKSKQLKAQAVFCIDVRSEVFRRNLELIDPEINTIGFAGFFAFPIKYVPVGQNEGDAQCPVLIKTGPVIVEEIQDQEVNQKAKQSRVKKLQIKQFWKSFKSGAISCFSFVSPVGLSYLPKLFTDSFGITRPVSHPDNAGLKSEFSKNKRVSLEVGMHNKEMVGIQMHDRVQMAKNALNAMTLTDSFGKFVLIVGHGSATVNNPHATGLDCGACGGHTGESNAKVAAAVLNDPEVRKRLKEEQIDIPENTVFLACLHNTTTDEVSIFNEYEVPEDLVQELESLKNSLSKAGQASRTERAVRMTTTGEVDASIIGRSKDWSQVRPEWGLAGCSAFVVAPRERTQHIDFGGRSFLHSYEWQNDKGFSILELIMTAPMVVTSWINLQYYASTVDNKTFGSGNKTLHNVTAGVGVLEGYSGDLRVGLPMQSVHDGEKFQHEPVRLNVIIEAPIEAMNTILEKHENVRNLCDNEWIHLLAMNEEGQVSHRYAGGLTWEPIASSNHTH